jgi:mycofactocin precursor peptide peptidase
LIRRLAEMTWPDVADAVRAGATTVVLPLGATEQHGPHLPLGTDTIRALALAERLAERLGPSVLVAPTLPFGCSDEHAGFPGLLGLQHETLARVIVDLARRLTGWGVRRLVLLSAHGGNGEALDLALARLRRELPDLTVRTNGDLQTIAPVLLEVARRDGIPANALGVHAGEGETSEMLHLRPDLVRSKNSAPGFTGDIEAVLDELRAGGLRAVTEQGVLGDPTNAEAGRGARYLDVLTDDLAALIGDEDAS